MILIAAVWLALSRVFFSKAYLAFYLTLKRRYPDRFASLMSKGPLVEAHGEWIRRPDGSVYLFIDAFSRSPEDSVDVAKVKARVRRYGVLFVVAVVFTFSLAWITALVSS